MQGQQLDKHWIRSALEKSAVTVTSAVVIILVGFTFRMVMSTFKVEQNENNIDRHEIWLEMLDHESVETRLLIFTNTKDIEAIKSAQNEGFKNMQRQLDNLQGAILLELRKR